MFTEKIDFRRSIFPGVILAIAGLILLVVPYDALVDMLFAVIGLIIIVLNIFPCILYWMSYTNDKRMLSPAILATISVVVGFVFIFWHNWVICVILAIWLIALPIIRIAQANDKMERFKKEVIYFVIAALLFFTTAEAIFSIVVKVFGGIILALGIVRIVQAIMYNRKSNDDSDNNSSNKRDDVIDAKYEEIN